LKNTGFPVERQQREVRTGEKKNKTAQDKTNTEAQRTPRATEKSVKNMYGKSEKQKLKPLYLSAFTVYDSFLRVPYLKIFFENPERVLFTSRGALCSSASSVFSVFVFLRTLFSLLRLPPRVFF